MVEVKVEWKGGAGCQYIRWDITGSPRERRAKVREMYKHLTKVVSPDAVTWSEGESASMVYIHDAARGRKVKERGKEGMENQSLKRANKKTPKPLKTSIETPAACLK